MVLKHMDMMEIRMRLTFLGKNATSEELLGLGVNETWKDTIIQFKGKVKVAVSDNESSLQRVCLRNRMIIRLVCCIVFVM